MKLVQFKEVREGQEFFDTHLREWFVKISDVTAHRKESSIKLPYPYLSKDMVEIPDPE